MNSVRGRALVGTYAYRYAVLCYARRELIPTYAVPDLTATDLTDFFPARLNHFLKHVALYKACLVSRLSAH